MLNSHDGTPQPLMLDEDHVALFDDERQAEEESEHSFRGNKFGYEIYEWNW